MRISRALLAYVLVGCGAKSAGPLEAGAPDGDILMDATGIVGRPAIEGDSSSLGPAHGDNTSDAADGDGPPDAADGDGAVCPEGETICRDCCGRSYCAAAPCVRGYDCPPCPQ